MEEFIEGEMVTFDGLVDKDGKIVFYSSLIHNTPVLNIFSDPEDMYYYFPREIPKDLVKLGEKCVKAFGIKERFFHFEFFRTKPKGKLLAIEINCRPPGGATIDMFNYANDIDVFKEYANIVTKNKFESEVTRPYFCAYLAHDLSKNYVHSEYEIQEKYGENIVNIISVPGIFAGVLGNKGYIFRTETEDEMFTIINYIKEVR